MFARRIDEMESARTLAVQTEVLSEGLSNTELEALLDEETDRPCISVQVARGETLIGTVEEGEVRASTDSSGDLNPFVMSRIDTSRVMRAGMKDNN